MVVGQKWNLLIKLEAASHWLPSQVELIVHANDLVTWQALQYVVLPPMLGGSEFFIKGFPHLLRLVSLRCVYWRQFDGSHGFRVGENGANRLLLLVQAVITRLRCSGSCLVNCSCLRLLEITCSFVLRGLLRAFLNRFEGAFLATLRSLGSGGS